MGGGPNTAVAGVVVVAAARLCEQDMLADHTTVVLEGRGCLGRVLAERSGCD